MYPHVQAVAEACLDAVRPGDERSPNEAVGCGSQTMILAQPAKHSKPPRSSRRFTLGGCSFSSLNRPWRVPGDAHDGPGFLPRSRIRQADRQPHRRAPRRGSRGFAASAPALSRARTRPWRSRSAPGPTPAGRGAGGLGCAGSRTRTAGR